MNVKQLFEKLDVPDFVQFIYFRFYQCIGKEDTSERAKKEIGSALRHFARTMLEIRQDPEFWSDICKIAEEKPIG